MTVRVLHPSIDIQLALAMSVIGSAVGLEVHWPLWAITLALFGPWLPRIALDTKRAYGGQLWLGLFYVLTAMQLAHFGEHIAQMVQIHLLGLVGADAQGIFGVFNVEWLHFAFNTCIIVGVLVLLAAKYGDNMLLRVTAVLAGWHEVEHIAIMYAYLTTGISGTPGLLSQGGAIGGGLPMLRADLHFLYNLAETVPLVLAFIWQARRSAPASPPDAGRRPLRLTGQAISRRTPI